jgi:hypothetical protein
MLEIIDILPNFGEFLLNVKHLSKNAKNSEWLYKLGDGIDNIKNVQIATRNLNTRKARKVH